MGLCFHQLFYSIWLYSCSTPENFTSRLRTWGVWDLVSCRGFHVKRRCTSERWSSVVEISSICFVSSESCRFEVHPLSMVAFCCYQGTLCSWVVLVKLKLKC